MMKVFKKNVLQKYKLQILEKALCIFCFNITIDILYYPETRTTQINCTNNYNKQNKKCLPRDYVQLNKLPAVAGYKPFTIKK